MNAIKDCNHRCLSFGSGAFYIFCHDCRHTWICASRVEPHHVCSSVECTARPNPPPVAPIADPPAADHPAAEDQA